jgi:Uma2 family endonuclease
MTTVQTLLTAEQFASLPEPEEGGKMELVDGKVVCMTPVGQQHGRRASRLSAALQSFADQHALGYVGVEIGYRIGRGPDTVLAPDVVFVEEDPNAPELPTFVDGPPTLAVEIMSPDDRELEVSAKVRRYLDAGTNRVWIVRPGERTITVHRPGGDAHTFTIDDTLTSADAGFAVDGFDFPLREAFR